MDDFQYLKLISFTRMKIKITDQKSSLSANKVAFYPGTLVRVGSSNIFIIVSLLVTILMSVGHHILGCCSTIYCYAMLATNC